MHGCSQAIPLAAVDEEERASNFRRGHKGLRFAIPVLVGLVAGGSVLLVTKWPFTRRAVIHSLEKASSALVEIHQIHAVFFPYPGCVAEGVVIHHPGDATGPPLLTIARMTVQGDYSRLLRFSKDLNLIHTEGMHIRIRAGKQPKARSGSHLGASVTIDTLVADRTVLEFASSEAGKPPFLISIHRAQLSPVSGHRVLNFETDLHIPTPPGEVHSSGQFGPWDGQDPFATKVAGTYRLQHADLGFARGIGGILESEGNYHGPLRNLEVTDSATVPDFRVASANHRVGMSAHFAATVNGENGDTKLREVSAHFRQTDVMGSGAIAGQAAGGDKVVTLALAVPRGRIDDFLYLLDQSPRPSLEGDLWLQTQVELPPDSQPFLKKLRMNGQFQIRKAHFTAPATRESLDRIRDKSKGERTDYTVDAVSNLVGKAAVAEGVARLSDIRFHMAGASAHVSGTYDLLSTMLDLRGMAHLDTGLSSASTGLKAMLLRILNPFFKSKGQKGSDVPIKITGTEGDTSLGISLHKR